MIPSVTILLKTFHHFVRSSSAYFHYTETHCCFYWDISCWELHHMQISIFSSATRMGW